MLRPRSDKRAVPPRSRTARAMAKRCLGRRARLPRLAATALALGAAACGGAARPTAVVDAPLGPAADPMAVSGRLITIAARPDGQNLVESLDLAGGERSTLWTTGPEVADWRVSPDGERAAYRAANRSPRAGESIEVRELTEGAVPRVVASVDPLAERISGHAFSADGSVLIYARQAVRGDGGASLWLAGALPGDERRPGNDRLHRAIGGYPPPAPALALVAWSSALDRAVLREDAPDGGPIAGVGFSAAGAGTLEAAARSSAPGADALMAAAPDASRVAWLPRDGGAVVIDEGAGGARAVASLTAGDRPAGPLFDPEGAVLAFQVVPAAGGPSFVRLVDVREGAPLHDVRLAGQDLQPLAFAPDGAWLLLGAGAPGVLDPDRLAVAEVATGALSALAWPPPAGLWGAAWLPAR